MMMETKGENMNEEFLWVEKYRPRTVAETILPVELKKTFQQFVDQKNVPNLLLSGRAGVGKTTIAKAMLNELDADYITINGSMNGNIDTLRVEISNFASSMSFKGGRKYVILDEADYLNPNSTQPALRNFMEEFSNNCGFILTCNFKNRIIEPLHSRCSVIEFGIAKADKPKMAAQFYKRVCDILNDEGVKYEKSSVAELINLHFPDWRRTLNELQRYSATGQIDAGVLSNSSDDNINTLISYLKDKKFTEMRKWVGENTDVDSSVLYRQLYDILPTKLKSTTSVAGAIIVLAEYQYKEAFVANSEINRVAALATLMAECDWK
jgi:DNA polymerase III delta prime subunit